MAVLCICCLFIPPLAAQTQRGSTLSASPDATEERLRVMGKVVASRSAVIAGQVAGAVESLPVRVGDSVKKGQVLARLRARPLELKLASATGELAEAEARLRSAELRLERTRTLAASEVVSSQIADDARFEVQSWQGRVARLVAEVERYRDVLNQATVRAPFAGTVVAEKTQVGQWMNVGSPVVELVSLDRLEARLDVPEEHFSGLQNGSQVRIFAQSSDRSKSVTGTLRAVVPRSAARAHTLHVYVTLPAGSGLPVGAAIYGELVVVSSGLRAGETGVR